MSNVLQFRKKNVKDFSDEELKALLDRAVSPYFDVDGIELSAIHLELNLRGLGKYCAV